MSTENDRFSHSFMDNQNILVGAIKESNLDKDNSQEILDLVQDDLANYPNYEHYILDVREVEKVSNSALGVLLKAMNIIKHTGSYMILVMTEDLLQKIMIEQPIMFDYFAVFHSVDEAIEYIKAKS
ncbi:MAG TPA: STAS domain-containing protein [Spirochaetota bacterium]|nr:STAS domain-containing protein [Spirochaetota bacterium]